MSSRGSLRRKQPRRRIRNFAKSARKEKRMVKELKRVKSSR
jgi:hypothetical protein